jgi:hypothetical protein
METSFIAEDAGDERFRNELEKTVGPLDGLQENCFHVHAPGSG